MLRKTLRRFALTRTFLPAVVTYRLETALSVAVGEEVRRMKYFKITKTWAVKAELESEAIIGDYDKSNLYEIAQSQHHNISRELAAEYNQFVEIEECKLTVE
jgi:hypothetical protein